MSRLIHDNIHMLHEAKPYDGTPVEYYPGTNTTGMEVKEISMEEFMDVRTANANKDQ